MQEKLPPGMNHFPTGLAQRVVDSSLAVLQRRQALFQGVDLCQQLLPQAGAAAPVERAVPVTTITLVQFQFIVGIYGHSLPHVDTGT
jgi:hypothetical protein